LINPKDNPIEWTLLGYELEEVKEHLDSLLAGLDPENGIDEVDFKVQVFHLITHLNRIYNSRNHEGEVTNETFSEYSEVPNDFSAMG
jgi:hypothetical protein